MEEFRLTEEEVEDMLWKTYKVTKHWADMKPSDRDRRIAANETYDLMREMLMEVLKKG